MKYYKCTFLKDYPGYKKGVVVGGIGEDIFDDFCVPCYRGKINLSEIAFLAKEYSDFVKTELDDSYSLDVCCPCCKGTVVFPYIDTEQEIEDGEIYVIVSSGLECICCGNKREIIKESHHVWRR